MTDDDEVLIAAATIQHVLRQVPADKRLAVLERVLAKMRVRGRRCGVAALAREPVRPPNRDTARAGQQ